MIMKLEELFDEILGCQNNYIIQYTNIDGEEKLFINGIEQEFEEDEFDDSEVKNEISKFKEIIEILPDDLFIKFVDDLKEIMDINQVNDLFEQDSFNEDDANLVTDLIDQCKVILTELINNRMRDLLELSMKL